MFELIYTATPKGLLQGRSGFATVAMTTGFPPNLIPSIENMSGFRNLYMPGDPHVADNPVNCTYQQLRFGSSVLLVVSEIRYAGLSYTGRSNTLAHHYIFTSGDPLWTTCSPASLLQCAENFPPWQGEPRLLPEKTQLPQASFPAEYAAWERLIGSADWGKIVTAMIKRKMAPAIVLQFSPAHHRRDDLLSLISEVSAALTPQERLDFTFSTYCYQSAIGNPVFLRAYPENSTLLESIKYLHQEQVLVLGENNAIPEKFRELLRQPKAEKTETLFLPPKPPEIVISPELPPELPPIAAPPPPVHSVESGKPATSSRRNVWIIGIATVLLLAFAGSFALLKFYGEEKLPPSPAPSTVSAPVKKPAALPPPAMPAPVEKVRIAPQKPPRKSVPVKSKPVNKPTITDEQWFEFFLTLHDGKQECPLPDALKNGSLKQIVLKRKYAVAGKISDVFDVSGNAIVIYAVKTDESDPTDPKELPDLEKIEMTLKIENGKLIVDPVEKSDAIKSLVFVVGDFQFPFVNEFQDLYWKVAIPRIRIDSKWALETLQLKAEYAGSRFMERKIQESLRWQVKMDQGKKEYPLLPGKITIPQFAQLETLLQKRRKFRDAESKMNTEPLMDEPELFSPKLQSFLKKYYSREEKNALMQAMRDNKLTLSELQDEICKQIYQRKKGASEKEWKTDQNTARKLIENYQLEQKKYADNLKKHNKLESDFQEAKKRLLAAEAEFKKYPWCGAILKDFEGARGKDEELRDAVTRKYQKETQIKLVRKTEI